MPASTSRGCRFADGSRPAGAEELLSSGSERDRYPAFSFDGKRLAYSSNRDGRLGVWVEDLQTLRRQRALAPQEGLEMYAPAWLPDGNTLVSLGSRLEASQVRGARSLWLLSLDGSRAEQLLDSPRLPALVRSVNVSPDGRRVLVPLTDETGIELFEVDLATRKERRLTATPGNKYDGVWSPDGRTLAFTATTGSAVQLWTQPAGGDEARQLTFGSERMRHPSFSPDGKWIYVQPSHRNIWRVPAAGGRLERVTDFPESGLFLEEPTLSPDGRALAYARWKGGGSLWLLRLGGAEEAAGRH
jgi:Tol biopolymer transport system component